MYCNLNNRTYFTQLACCRISFIKKREVLKFLYLQGKQTPDLLMFVNRICWHTPWFELITTKYVGDSTKRYLRDVFSNKNEIV
jgi:hypothetical protein